MGLLPETRRADRGVSRTPVARSTRRGMIRASPSGVDTRELGAALDGGHGGVGPDIHAGGFGRCPQPRGVVGTRENAAELPHAERRMAAVTGDSPCRHLPLEDGNVSDPEAFQVGGGAESCRAAADDGHIAPDHPVVHGAGCRMAASMGCSRKPAVISLSSALQ